MSAVSRQSVGDLLSELASVNESPSAGTAAALACAQAAALLELTATLAAKRLDADQPMTHLAASASILQSAAILALEHERTAYTEAVKSGSLEKAADAPLAIALAAAEVADGAADVARAGDWPFTPDAVAAAVLAESAATIAALIVRANLRDVPNDPRLEIAAKASTQAAAAVERANAS